MQHISIALLLVGAAKTAVWLAILAVAADQRRLLPITYAPLGVIASTVRSLTDAHVHIPAWSTQAAAFVGTPIAFLLLASLLVTRPTIRARGTWSL